MDFTSSEDVKAFVQKQVSQMINATGGQFRAHPRLQWRYRHLPAGETNAGHLEWKITKAGANETFEYWTLSVTSDRCWFILTHGNTDAGAQTIQEQLLTSAFVIDAKMISEYGPSSLASVLEHALARSAPNHYGLS